MRSRATCSRASAHGITIDSRTVEIAGIPALTVQLGPEPPHSIGKCAFGFEHRRRRCGVVVLPSVTTDLFETTPDEEHHAGQAAAVEVRRRQAIRSRAGRSIPGPERARVPGRKGNIHSHARTYEEQHDFTSGHAGL
jgi:hypothetical protein